jgi:hypothetical protein
MAFTKGISGNPRGRRPGSKDKAKKDIKQAFQSLIENNLSNIEKWLNEVAVDNPAKALDIILKLTEFILPKMKAMELTEENEQSENKEPDEALKRFNFNTSPEELLQRAVQMLEESNNLKPLNN